MKMIGVGGGYRMEKEFDVEIKEVLSRVQRVKAEHLMMPLIKQWIDDL